MIPRVKVCGIRSEQDMHAALEAGVDTVGINLVASSPRYVEPQDAIRLASVASSIGLTVVAVLRDPGPDEVGWLQSNAGSFDFLQLHGKEVPSLCTQLPQCSFIKAIPWSGRIEEQQLAAAWSDHPQLVAYLVDAYAPVEGGGTGKQARWDLLDPRPGVLASKPLVLAGGITPANVREAIRIVQPNGVDTASGVEIRPGVKSLELMRDFANYAFEAFGKRAII